MNKGTFFLVFVFSVFVGLVGCLKQENSTPQKPIADVYQKTSTNIYPHTGAFATSNAHGKAFYNNSNTCKSCHGSDLRGGTSQVSCASCHKSYPHSDEFKKNGHGTFFISDKANCKTCHGSDYKGGGAQVSCTSCHNEFPHAENFKLSRLHGQRYYADKQNCKTCHGSDLQGGKVQIACDSCHKGFPHNEEFKTTFAHGAKFFEDRNTCTTCHGKDFKGGSSKVACQNCHSFPHDAKWASPSQHGAAFTEIMNAQPDVKPHERDASKCLKCHENKDPAADNFKGRHPEQHVACSTCHADMPHGQYFLPGPGQDSPTRHKNYVKEHPEKIGSCFSCHLNPARKVPKIEKCLKCHEAAPEAAFPVIGFPKEKEEKPAPPPPQKPNPPPQTRPEDPPSPPPVEPVDPPRE